MNEHALAQAGWREIGLWLIGRRKRIRVTGRSMAPLLQPDEEVLVDLQAYRTDTPCVGEIVLTTHPHQPEQKIIKQVYALLPDGRIELRGVNPDPTHSTDSRQWGPFAPAEILGRVSARFA